MLDQLRRDITNRLDELVGEADKLRHALTALAPRQRNGSSTAASSASRSRPARANSRAAGTAPKRSRATGNTKATPARSSTSKQTAKVKAKPAARTSARTAPGATKAAVLAALGTGETMTATEVASKTGLGAATVSTTLSRLVKTGEISKANRGYQAKKPTGKTSTGNTGTATPK